jgi:plasmid stability protein
MTDLLIRQMPEELHRKLKARARANRRSMNQEILVLLEQSVAGEGVRPVPTVRPLKGAFPIDDEWLRRARDEGRA